jgi:NAD(P) transhydrogenase subunit alpha
MSIVLDQLDSLYFIVFCIFIGIEIITNVPAILHTPLMSGANAISGVITVGAIFMLHKVETTDYLNLIIGGVAVFLGALNISGGFFVTNRMLAMFNSKNK